MESGNDGSVAEKVVADGRGIPKIDCKAGTINGQGGKLCALGFFSKTKI